VAVLAFCRSDRCFGKAFTEDETHNIQSLRVQAAVRDTRVVESGQARDRGKWGNYCFEVISARVVLSFIVFTYFPLF